MYEYQQGRKGAGKGFIKVEAKNGVCRIRYKLAGIFGKGEGTAEVIGYVREGDRCRGVRLGRWTSAGSSAEFEQELDEENLNGSGYSLNRHGAGSVLKTSDRYPGGRRLCVHGMQCGLSGHSRKTGG